MDAQSGSRALGAVSDLIELLRLAQAATERVAQEVYGVSYEHAELIERELQRLRRSAEKLKQAVESHVAREDTASIERGHPLRRAGDRSTPHN
ncbi:MAG TPA: hypothetical protein VFK84_07910 [Burkholderiales bacterium]|nr:hypothetical protein [Burkholderiales bacterium]